MRAAAGQALAVAALAAATSPAAAQTGYYNTDAGHPLTIEDAYAVERWALELQPGGVVVSRHTGGLTALQVEPELAFGVLPRTQLEASLAWRRVERGAVYQSGLAGVRVGVLHNLNVETRSLPALAVAAEYRAPAGPLAPTDGYATLEAIATRTWPAARLHLNAGGAFGRAPSSVPVTHGVVAEVPRWLVGVAADRAFAFRSLLASGELLAKRPTIPGHPVVWEGAVGTRVQAAPTIVLDAGVSRHLTGDDRTWTLTAGAAWAVGVRR